MKNLLLIFGTLTVLSGLGVITVNKEIFAPNKEANALLTKGKLLLEQDNEETMRKAVELFTTVASHFPDTNQAQEALYYLAESYEKLGNIDVAIGKYRRLLATDMDQDLSEQVQFKISKLQLSRYNTEEGFNGLMVLLSKTTDENLRSEIYVEIARYYSRQKEYDQAMKNYEIALSENPKNPDANMELARAYFETGRHDEAFLQFKKFFNIYVDRNRSREDIANRFATQMFKTGADTLSVGEPEAAKKYFSFIAENFAYTQHAEESLYYLGNVLFMEKRYTEAIGVFEEVISRRPNTRDENAYIKKGQAHYERADYAAAIGAFSKARSEFPDGKFSALALQWESEARNLLLETQAMEKTNQPDYIEEDQTGLLPPALHDEPTLGGGDIIEP